MGCDYKHGKNLESVRTDTGLEMAIEAVKDALRSEYLRGYSDACRDIVRCRDCVHLMEPMLGYYECGIRCNLDGEHDQVRLMGYCSLGERRAQ